MNDTMTEHTARRRIAAAVHELRRIWEMPMRVKEIEAALGAERAALNEALHTLTGYTLDELREVVG